MGFFFRINTRKIWQTSVLLKKTARMHMWLQWDSYLECGEPLELDEYVIEQSFNDRGVLGKVSASLGPEIFKAVSAARGISEADKLKIRIALGC